MKVLGVRMQSAGGGRYDVTSFDNGIDGNRSWSTEHAVNLEVGRPRVLRENRQARLELEPLAGGTFQITGTWTATNAPGTSVE
jgi:hypothetical protein